MDRRKTAMIALGWSFKAEGFSGSLVEPSRDGV
jgi:hypothetical protein